MRGVLNTLIHAMDLHQEGIIYGIITAREKNFLPGRSLRTISHAMRPPTRMLPTETQDAISKEFSRGR